MISNRPGLSRLDYRVGTYATFLEAMQARLSAPDAPELHALTTREKSDPAIALLDAWAVVADVLTFHQERIANEGYLRTASERRSVLELARLIGYELRPGVAASVYLAYALEKDSAPVEIPAGARANSIPAPGEQMQAFETAEPLPARVEWNAIKPRLTKPQTASTMAGNVLYLKGIATRLEAGDPLLIKFSDPDEPRCELIESVEIDSVNDRTKVTLVGPHESPVDDVRAIVERFSAVEDFDVDKDTAMSKRVLAVLESLAHTADSGPAALAAAIETGALPSLKEDALTARRGGFSKLLPWIEGLMAELDAARVRLTPSPEPQPPSTEAECKVGVPGDVIDSLEIAPSSPPASARRLPRGAENAYAFGQDTVPRLLGALRPALRGTLYTSWKNLPRRKPTLKVYAARAVAAPFGHNAPLRQVDPPSDKVEEPRRENVEEPRAAEAGDSRVRLPRPVMAEWEIGDPFNLMAAGEVDNVHDHHEPGKLFLDNDYPVEVKGDPKGAAKALVAIAYRGHEKPVVHVVDAIVHRSLTAYGLSGKTVELMLPGPGWIKPRQDFSAVRTTRVFTGAELLELTEAPIEDDVWGGSIELGDLYDGLQPGRWLIVAGERSDIFTDGMPVPGVMAAELVMLAAVEQSSESPSDTPAGVPPNSGDPGCDRVRTFIRLATGLAYRYRRDTVTIHGNVVRATQGETRQEVLGSGDATKALQQFTLRQPPLTYVSAPTVSGVESTLEVRVNNVEWHQAPNLGALGSMDRKFIARTDDEPRTSIVFGDGERGVRLPTGRENVSAIYRNGIGKSGNVKAGQITLLASRPLGVKEVVNPIRASGGAERESRDQARRNAPLALMALDRLVSTQDYADFARTFAGVGKAVALRVPGIGRGTSRRVSCRRQARVQVAIAGVDDAPIDTTSDLYRNLADALSRFGDPYLPIEIIVRTRLVLVIAVKVRIDPDYRWELLEPVIRAAVLARFAFDNVELGEDLLLSDAIAVIQKVRGVAFVDVDIFDAISEQALLDGLTNATATSLGLADRIAIEPDQLAYLTADVPDSLILQELKP